VWPGHRRRVGHGAVDARLRLPSGPSTRWGSPGHPARAPQRPREEGQRQGQDPPGTNRVGKPRAGHRLRRAVVQDQERNHPAGRGRLWCAALSVAKRPQGAAVPRVSRPRHWRRREGQGWPAVPGRRAGVPGVRFTCPQKKPPRGQFQGELDLRGSRPGEGRAGDREVRGAARL